jgi:NAD(P)-dependent dehydrogenase (short-subunit alcohol dehydrogenase family)
MGVIDGRVAIITGGARGIGASISALFAAEGASLVINDLGGGPDGSGSDEGPAKQLADTIVAAGGTAVADGGDIGDVATGERLVRTAVDQFGRLDIVVNVAGILRDRMIFNLPEKDWDEVIRVHLKGHYSTVRPASAYWREQRNPRGHYRIINFTSNSGLEGSPGQPNYAAAKMGIVGLTYSLAQGLARYGVTANAISPGAATRLTATVPAERRVAAQPRGDTARPGDTPDPDGPIPPAPPAGGMGVDQAARPELSPDNIAPVALYLASERSAWLTGRVVSAMGFHVGLYENPQQIRQLSSPGPWPYDMLADAIEQNFRPVADGLPPSIFRPQASREAQ